MIMTALDRAILAGRVRSLVASGRYAEAQRSFEEYCRALAEALAALPPKDPRIRELEEEWRRVSSETRRRVLTGRAHAAARLARLARPPRSYGDPADHRHTWQYFT